MDASENDPAQPAETVESEVDKSSSTRAKKEKVDKAGKKQSQAVLDKKSPFEQTEASDKNDKNASIRATEQQLAALKAIATHLNAKKPYTEVAEELWKTALVKAGTRLNKITDGIRHCKSKLLRAKETLGKQTPGAKRHAERMEEHRRMKAEGLQKSKKALNELNSVTKKLKERQEGKHKRLRGQAETEHQEAEEENKEESNAAENAAEDTTEKKKKLSLMVESKKWYEEYKKLKKHSREQFKARKTGNLLHESWGADGGESWGAGDTPTGQPQSVQPQNEITRARHFGTDINSSKHNNYGTSDTVRKDSAKTFPQEDHKAGQDDNGGDVVRKPRVGEKGYVPVQNITRLRPKPQRPAGGSRMTLNDSDDD